MSAYALFQHALEVAQPEFIKYSVFVCVCVGGGCKWEGDNVLLHQFM